MTGAAENPFRVDRIEALTWRAPDFDWEDFLASLEQPGLRGAIVGPHGSGKTTLLLEAQRHLADRGVAVAYGFLNEETPRKAAQALHLVRSTAPDTLLFLDGAEQLHPLAWWRVRRAAARLRGLVITIHQPGRLPTLLTTRTDEALLHALLQELAPHQIEHIWPRAQAHHQRLNGNIREVFFALYDDWSRNRL